MITGEVVLRVWVILRVCDLSCGCPAGLSPPRLQGCRGFIRSLEVSCSCQVNSLSHVDAKRAAVSSREGPLRLVLVGFGLRQPLSSPARLWRHCGGPRYFDWLFRLSRSQGHLLLCLLLLWATSCATSSRFTGRMLTPVGVGIPQAALNCTRPSFIFVFLREGEVFRVERKFSTPEAASLTPAWPAGVGVPTQTGHTRGSKVSHQP